MRISLINVQTSEGNNIVPPLGVLYIAAVLERAGHAVQVHDVDPEAHSCLAALLEFAPEIVGLSFFSNTYNKARRLHRIIRERLPGAVTVCGGIHATSIPEPTLREMAPDYLVVGEGERSMLELVRCLEAGGDIDEARIPGVYYLREGKPRIHGPAELIADLDELPFPARHLLEYSPYLVPPGMIRGLSTPRVTTIFTSRGCPYPCIYCASSNIQGKKVRRRSPENVIAELEQLIASYAINGFYICDDLVTFDHPWMMAFCELLEQSRLGLVWACQSRVDRVTPELAAAMRASGCVQIDFGVESGSDKTLKTMKKRTTAQAARDAFRVVHAAGIRTCATFIIGFPGETLADMEETYRLAKEIRPHYTAFYYLTPYPGTEIYHQAVANGWIDSETLSTDQLTHRQADLPVMAIEYPPEQLAAVRGRFQNHFFFRNYFNRQNLLFMVEVGAVMLCNPVASIRCVLRTIRLRRLDFLVESLFEMHQNWQRRKIACSQ